MEIDKKLKIDLKNIENKYLELENINKKLNDNLNVLTNEKTIWINKDKYMTEFLNRNGFIDSDELESFIVKYKSHNCLCSCPAIEDNEKYKEQVMNVDILKFNEKERLRVEKENDDLRYDIDIGMKKRDRYIENLNNKLLLIDKKVKLEKSNKYNENLFNNYINEINDECYYIENVEIEDNIVNVKFEKPNEVVINNHSHDINLENNSNLLNISNKSDEYELKIIELENRIKELTKNNNINEKKLKIPSLSKSNNDIIKEKDFNCPVSFYTENTTETRKYGAKETYIKIKYYHDLYEKHLNEKKENFDPLGDCIKYLFKVRNINYNKYSKLRYSNRVMRCHELYKSFKEDIHKTYFSLDSLIKIPIKHWKQWKEYYNIKIEEFKKIAEKCNLNKNNKINIDIKNIKNKIIKVLILNYYKNKYIKKKVAEKCNFDKSDEIINNQNKIKYDDSDKDYEGSYYENYCIIDDCDNYVPEKGWTCKSHL